MKNISWFIVCIFLTLPTFALSASPQKNQKNQKKTAKKPPIPKAIKRAVKKAIKKTTPLKSSKKKALGTISIQSNIPKAEIYSGGKLMGVTPSKLQLAVGKFTLYLYKKDYVIHVVRGVLKAGEVLNFSVKLTRDISVPQGINLKYAPVFIKSRKKAMTLLQRVFIYLSHFHVEAPKESALVLGALRTMINGPNKIKQREALLKKLLNPKDLDAFYIADVDLTAYPTIQLKETKVGKKIHFFLSLPGHKKKITLEPTSITSCFLALEDTYDFLAKFYDQKKIIGDNGLFFLALKGMLAVLKDPHTRLIPPKDLKEMNMEVSGQFGGLGIVISTVNGILTVITPMDDTPAARKGILEGDQIVKIEGKSTRGMTLVQAVKLMRGKPGTPITITVQRGASHKKITLIRAIIKIKFVKATMLKNHIGIIRLSSFMGKKVPGQIQKALEKLKKQGLKGLILDLRNNPGGLLDNAQKVASFFLKKGDLVVYTKGRNPLYNETLNVDPQYLQKTQVPMVVLINKGSASASEIVSGALQDHKRAVLVGEVSYGKGSVQRVFPIPDFQMAFAITIAKYYLPSGRCIHHIGVTPNFIIVHSLLTRLKIRSRSLYKKKNEKINDLHLKKALEILQKKISKQK